MSKSPTISTSPRSGFPVGVLLLGLVLGGLMVGGLLAWVAKSRHRQAFDEAARIPLADDSKVPAP